MRVLVTGGAGFLGSRIVQRLLARGDEVTVCSRNASRALKPRDGLRVLDGDLRDHVHCAEAVSDQQAVIHVAAKAGVWGPRDEYFSTNTEATRALLLACHKHGVTRFVYTSTPSVVFTRGGIEGGDESLPYPPAFLTHYAETKALAEQSVLKANGKGMTTTALRPHLIWGSGDPHLLPRVLERAKAGKLKQVGDGCNRVDITHVNDAADAHLLALDNLEQAAGKAYFIHSETVELWPWINGVLERAGIAPVTSRVSRNTAFVAGAVLETAGKLLRQRTEPMMTRFVAENLATSHWFSIEAAKRDLGYQPQWTGEKALDEFFGSELQTSRGDAEAQRKTTATA
jgi:2-alkyl-3-oxoalkanoate reductase